MEDIKEIVRPIVKVGNSGGVLVPRAWVHGMARVVLLEKKPEPEKELFGILEEHLPEIQALALSGSYARDEQTNESDVDVLAITHTINLRIRQGKYDILLVSESHLKQCLENNILPLLPMLVEARALLNREMIHHYQQVHLTNKNLSFHFETSASALAVVAADFALLREAEMNEVSAATVYSLVVRLRELYIIDCLLKNKRWSTKGFLVLLRKITGTSHAYMEYQRVKQGAKIQGIIAFEVAEQLHMYISEHLHTQKMQWEKTHS